MSPVIADVVVNIHVNVRFAAYQWIALDDILDKCHEAGHALSQDLHWRSLVFPTRALSAPYTMTMSLADLRKIRSDLASRRTEIPSALLSFADQVRHLLDEIFKTEYPESRVIEVSL